MTEPFGALAPSAFEARVRALGGRLPTTSFGRKAASLLLGPAGGRARRAYDVSVFDTQKARLHPYDNICEKRVYLTPQFWEAAEREALAARIAAHDRDVFTFVDIGANVGLYTLFARAECARRGLRLDALCIEADPDMQERLAFNRRASAAESEIRIVGCAASDADGSLRFAVNRKSRGMSRLDVGGEIEVSARPLLAILNEAGITRIDALKIDIEGHEAAALSAFFRDAPAALHPDLAIVETSHAEEAASAEAPFVAADYAVALRTKRNVVLAKAARARIAGDAAGSANCAERTR